MSGQGSFSRWVRRSMIVLVATVALVAFGSGPAGADQFSPYPGTGVNTYTSQFGDSCWLSVGPVKDPRPLDSAGRYAIIGGLTVQGCARRHSFQAWVYEYYGATGSGPWHLVAQGSTWLPNAYGFGSCSGCPNGRILETPRVCGGGPLYWYTSTVVREFDAYGNLVRQITLSGYAAGPVQARAQC